MLSDVSFQSLAKSLQHWRRTAGNHVARACDCRRHNGVNLRQKQYAANATSPMMSKCANPQCPKTLMRLNGGRFFGFVAKNNAIENFWLCSNCAAHYTLRQIEGRVEVVPRERKTA
jgi:hypothetical protein